MRFCAQARDLAQDPSPPPDDERDELWREGLVHVDEEAGVRGERLGPGCYQVI